MQRAARIAGIAVIACNRRDRASSPGIGKKNLARRRRYGEQPRFTMLANISHSGWLKTTNFLRMDPYRQAKSAHIAAKDGPIRASLSCSTQVYWTILLEP
jgi:hypothetical protein